MRAEGRGVMRGVQPLALVEDGAWRILRRGLMAGAAASALSGGQALAQAIDAPVATATEEVVVGGADAGEAPPGIRTITPQARAVRPPPPAPPPPPPPADDGLGERGFYLEADQVVRDDRANTITATGSVEARYQGRVLRAESVIYDLNAGTAQADGAVRIINADGTMQSADRVVLDRDLTAGFALGFATRLQNNGQLAAASLVRRSPEVDELNRAIYTPCPVCEDGESSEQPTWSIQARQVVRDHRRQVVYYRDAVIRVLGVPIFYTPIFWHPDPAVERQSGLLTPLVSASRVRGFTYEQPYLQVISPSEDVVARLQINSSAAPFLKLDWRRRFYSGYAEARVGYTNERDLDNNGNRFGERTHRSYILARGQFALTDRWRWGFTAERASEPLIFDKYDVDNVFTERGLYGVDDRRLISQVYTSYQAPDLYLSGAVISIQGLRASDTDQLFPTVAPLLEARWEPTNIAGGRLRVRGSAVYLSRNDSLTTPGAPGIDSGRVTGEIDWRRSMTFGSGIRLSPFVLARGDVYYLRDLPTPFSRTATVSRGFAVGGVDVTWPFFRRVSGGTVVVEPVVQLAFGNRQDLDPRLQNEDSQIFEFDSTNLFRINRSPGFDLYEGGNRLNVGARATLTLDNGLGGNLLVGQSFRSSFDPTIPTRTGLADTASDYIIAGEFTPLRGLTVFSRMRLDNDDLTIRRIEAGADYASSRAGAFVRYLREDVSPSGDPVEDLDFRGEVFVTRHWGISVYGVRDLEAGAWRQRDLGLIYQDDCTRVELVYRHGETFNRTLGPSESVVLRLTLATFGNSGYGR